MITGDFKHYITDDIYKNLGKFIENKTPFFMNAVFKGKNGSLGYKTNEEYNLFVDFYNNHISIEGKHAEYCLYSSIGALVRNWEIKKIIDGNEL